MDFRSWLRRSRKRLLQRPQPVILMYHRVASLKRDPWELAVSPDNFREQLRRLRQKRDILPLDDFLRLNGEGRLPRRAVAITFDDGYRDNLTNAAPLLAEFDAPATLFLATGPMRQQRGYWWDVLASMVLDAPVTEGRVRVGTEEIPCSLGSPKDDDDPSRTWLARQAPRTARQALYLRLWSAIRPLEPDQLSEVMAELAGLFPYRDISADGPMREDEVRTLLEIAPFTLGCHTVDHPDLPAIGRGSARGQLAKGKEEVEALTGRTVTSFAYPYGRHDAEVMRMVKEAGFFHACITKSGSLKGADPSALPRLAARNRPDVDWLNIRRAAA